MVLKVEEEEEEEEEEEGGRWQMTSSQFYRYFTVTLTLRSCHPNRLWCLPTICNTLDAKGKRFHLELILLLDNYLPQKSCVAKVFSVKPQRFLDTELPPLRERLVPHLVPRLKVQ